MKRSLTILATAVAAGALLLSACSAKPSSSASNSSGVTLITPGVLTVCTHLPFQPMESRDDSGNVVGFDFDLMQLVADNLGATVSVFETDPDQMSSGSAMIANKCDIAAEGMTITPARAQAVSFSIPYFSASQTLAVPSSSDAKSLSDMSGKNLGVIASSTGYEYANNNQTTYGYNIVQYDDGATLMNSLLSGRSDGILYDFNYVSLFTQDNPTTKIAQQIDTGEVYGFACANTDNGKALTAVVNQVLTTANSDGTYLKIFQKWIDPNATSAALPTS